MNHTVFVYGALRKGASNAWRMKESSFVSKASVSGVLVKVDWYPGLVLGPEGRVFGEVYEVNEQVLAELDVFEGVGLSDEREGEYQRVKAQVVLENGETRDCLIYEWQLGVENYEKVANGDWLTVKIASSS